MAVKTGGGGTAGVFWWRCLEAKLFGAKRLIRSSMGIECRGANSESRTSEKAAAKEHRKNLRGKPQRLLCPTDKFSYSCCHREVESTPIVVFSL